VKFQSFIFFLLPDSLVGVGVSFIIKAFHSEEKRADVFHGSLGPTAIIFLIYTLLFPLMLLTMTNFHAKKSIGIFCISLYMIFITIAILSEFDVIHPFGIDDYHPV
jgi:Ca2+/Na+ antiporter